MVNDKPADDDMSEADPQQLPPKPPADDEISEAEAQQQPADQTSASLSYDGRFIQYNIFGNVFEVTSKYDAPIVPIGRGAYGIVCSVVNSETNESVAVKKIENAFYNKTDAKRTLREIMILRQMDHENVIAIRDVIPPPQRDAFNDVYIAYELMESDLQRLIRSKHHMGDEHFQWFMYQILRGLKYIHSANVLHRDLKPSNLLVNKNCDLKICDFGLARVVSDTDFTTEFIVTRWYRPPEILLMSTAYTAAIDMWSVGCIFMELMDRQPLFPGNDHAHQFRLIIQMIGTPRENELEHLNEDAKRFMRLLPLYPRQSFAERFPKVHPLAADLVQRMLVFDPKHRIKVEDALTHPYLKSVYDMNEEPICTDPLSRDIEQLDLTEDEMKEMIYQEALYFNPEYRPPPPPAL